MYKYPYGDSQQLNLDWILAKLKELEDASIGLDLEVVSNALISLTYNTSTAYRRYDYAFLNGKLYRCLTDTTGAFDPAAWMEVRIGEDIPVLTRLLNADDAAITTLQNQMSSLRPTLQVNTISDLSTSLNRFVSFGSAINMAGITIPQYAKGVLVSQGGADATLYVISLEGKLYTAFRNNGTWVNGKCINNEISDLNGAITSNTTVITGIENAIAYVENNFQSASRTYKAGEFFYSTQYNRLYKTNDVVPQYTTFENHVGWITEGGLNNAITPTSETISTGISGVSAKKINGWFVQIGFYITTAITIDAGALYSLGTLPEALRPTVNQSYLLLFAKANNAPTVAGLRVAASGEVLVYNIGGSAVTYQTIQGLAYYQTI